MTATGAVTERPHAPAPWTIIEYGDGDTLVIHSDDENRVCFMATHGGSRAAWEIIQANAAHIVRCVNAFDEMKAALKAIEWVETETWFCPACGGFKCNGHEADCTTDRALALATGATPCT